MKKWWKPKRDKGTIHALTLCTDVEATEAYRMGVEALRRQQWIPVSERLPESGVPVLVNYIGNDDGKMHPDGVAVWTDYCCLWWAGSLKDCDTEVMVPITHWMPLPEPPEEGAPGND